MSTEIPSKCPKCGEQRYEQLESGSWVFGCQSVWARVFGTDDWCLLETTHCLARQEIAMLKERVCEGDNALYFLNRKGYRRCDIPACNCGSWHGGHASDRLMEINEELGELVQGKTILQAVAALKERAERAEARVRELEGRQ